MSTTIDEIIDLARLGGYTDRATLALARYVRDLEQRLSPEPVAAPLDEVSRYRIALLAIGDIVDCFGPVSPEADDPNAWHLYAGRVGDAVKRRCADRGGDPMVAAELNAALAEAELS